MPRRRPGLTPLAPTVRPEDEGTWMLTFSDLVLLLLAFVAIGILMERSRGPHVITDRLQARAPVTAEPVDESTFALVEEPTPSEAARNRPIDPRLRELADRIETRLAAEGLPGLRPVVLDADGITVEIGATTGQPEPIVPLPRLAPTRVTVVDTDDTATTSDRERALARAARVAQELIAGDPLLAVHTARYGTRLEIRLAG